MYKKKLTLSLLIIGLCFLLSGCSSSKNVENYDLSLNLEGNSYTGLYTGILESGNPTGEGSFISEEGWTINGTFSENGFSGKIENFNYTVEFQDNTYEGIFNGEVNNLTVNGTGNFEGKNKEHYLNYNGEWNEGIISGLGEVETDSYTIYFDDSAREGTYEGEVKDGLAEGNGVFKAINSENNAYTYTGEFSNGLFEGQGSWIFDTEDVVKRIGTFSKGNYTPTLLEGVTAFGSRDSLQFSPNSNAKEFINNHEKIFISNNATENADIAELFDTELKYIQFIKTPNSYGNKLIEWSGYTVHQIWVENYFDTDMQTMMILAYDNDGHGVLYFKL